MIDCTVSDLLGLINHSEHAAPDLVEFGVVNQVWSVSVYKGAEGQAILPA